MVVKVEHHFAERKHVLEQHSSLVKVDQIFLDPSAILKPIYNIEKHVQ